MNFKIVIPARLKSSRFPRKPLVDILGKSMIQRVWEKCIKALNKNDVFIATDAQEIQQHCQNHGIQVVMTSEHCLTGTDRVYDASKNIDADVYINVQGDEPLIEAEDILKVIKASQANPDKVINAMCKIINEDDFRNATIPKVVCGINGNLLYMSRAAIPTGKNLQFVSGMKQVCIYAYPKEILREFSKTENKTPLEAIEDIEIIRLLEIGVGVQMVEVSGSSVAVDTPKDLERVKNILLNE